MKNKIKEFDLNYEEDVFEVFQVSAKEVKEKLTSDENVNLINKKIGFILEAGAYQAGKFYQFLETKGEIFCNEEDREFLLSINPEKGCFKIYDGYVDQYKVLKLIYEKQEAKLEVINDFIATEEGYIKTMGVLFEPLEEN